MGPDGHLVQIEKRPLTRDFGNRPAERHTIICQKRGRNWPLLGELSSGRSSRSLCALIQARMGRIIYGSDDPKRGALGGTINLAGHKSAHHSMSIERGVMKEESRKIIVDWFKDKRNLSRGNLLSKLR